MTALLLALTLLPTQVPVAPKPTPMVPVASSTLEKLMSFYDFKMNDIDGKPVPLSEYKGKVVMVVNVASKCGLTPQYEELEALYEAKKDEGLVILGFPANEFGSQEPGTNAEIKEFCSLTYKVKFPMFSKIVVKGDKIDPLYTWLIEQAPRHEEIEWNFAKFLIDKDGKVINRFSPKETPKSDEVMAAIDAALAAPAKD